MNGCDGMSKLWFVACCHCDEIVVEVWSTPWTQLAQLSGGCRMQPVISTMAVGWEEPGVSIRPDVGAKELPGVF